MRVCVKPGKALGAKVGPDRLQLRTGQGGEGESKTWEEKRSEQPGRPYGSTASYAPCFPIAMRALPTHPIHNHTGKAGDSALVLMAGACQSALCLHSALLDLLLPATPASPAAQEATFLPVSSSQSLVQPWPKGAETSTSSLQRACPASLCSTFSAVELSCNFLVTVRGSVQKPALDSE